MSEERRAPEPMRFIVSGVSVAVRCSNPACTNVHHLNSLPLSVLDARMPPVVDRATLSALLPQGWKVGSLRARGSGLFTGGGEVVPTETLPVVFCPACGSGAT